MIRSLLILFFTVLVANGQNKNNLNFTSELSAFGLLSVPVGDFASTSSSNQSGYAMTGYGFGLDLFLRTEKDISVIVTGLYSSNKFDGNALLHTANAPQGTTIDIKNYSLFYLIGGAQIDLSLLEDVRLFGLGQVGILFGSFPGYDANNSGFTIRMSSSSASSLALGGGAGVEFLQKIQIRFRYMSSKPTYEGTYSNIQYNGEYGIEQPTKMMVFSVGYAF